ncbi:hypothetical protein Taro_020620 [Colocasia esculenta]|uniref:Uncharacterized protein n=1 Tax=Colocasia esculenta TaxID=4460 RepID=A0A843UZ80_COLES|nr:hypothetical protein [Colocasia esculenta]
MGFHQNPVKATYPCKGRDKVMIEGDRVLYGSRQGCLLRRPERDGVSCRVQNATRRGVATGLRIRSQTRHWIAD